jgi:hypothetical protein
LDGTINKRKGIFTLFGFLWESHASFKTLIGTILFALNGHRWARLPLLFTFKNKIKKMGKIQNKITYV